MERKYIKIKLLYDVKIDQEIYFFFHKFKEKNKVIEIMGYMGKGCNVWISSFLWERGSVDASVLRYIL